MKSFLELVEEKESTHKPVVMAFGRMNPPTTGHMKLIDKVKEIADKQGAKHEVIVSHSQDSKKNPLSGEQKVKHLQRYSPGTKFKSSSSEEPTILHHAARLHKAGHDHLTVVAGSDRVKEMHDLLHRYNGVEGRHGHYNFKKIEVKSAGHRDPDSEGAEGMSGTKMREHAKNKDFSSFRQGVPSHVSDKHAKELYHDTRSGMGLHEDYQRGKFKAIFVTGGPGSGKDVIIREAIAEGRIVELNFVQAKDYLLDKQKLSEKSNDFRREALRARGPLIINGPADDSERIAYIKEELEELGYGTMMVFVSTTNEVSKERNSLLSRMMVESIRHDKWLKSQKNTKYFTEAFDKFITFDNTGNIDSKEEDIHNVYVFTKNFLDSKVINETAEDWLNRNITLKEEKNVQSTNRFLKNKANRGRKPLHDNNAPIIQFQRKLGKIDDVRDGDIASNSSYIFRTYEAQEPKVEVQPEPKETNFQKDKEKINKRKWINQASGAIRSQGIGAEFDTRQQGTVYPMSGLGNVTYNEQKDFKKFKQFVEAIDDPGAYDMGVSGGEYGATNKEPLVTPLQKFGAAGITIKKKKKKDENI